MNAWYRRHAIVWKRNLLAGWPAEIHRNHPLLEVEGLAKQHRWIIKDAKPHHCWPTPGWGEGGQSLRKASHDLGRGQTQLKQRCGQNPAARQISHCRACVIGRVILLTPYTFCRGQQPGGEPCPTSGLPLLVGHLDSHWCLCWPRQRDHHWGPFARFSPLRCAAVILKMHNIPKSIDFRPFCPEWPKWPTTPPGGGNLGMLFEKWLTCFFWNGKWPSLPPGVSKQWCVWDTRFDSILIQQAHFIVKKHPIFLVWSSPP